MAINVFKVIGATYIICSGMGRKKLYRKAASFISLHLMLLLEDVIKRQEFQRSYSPISARLILCLFCIKHIYYVRTLHFASFIYIFFWRKARLVCHSACAMSLHKSVCETFLSVCAKSGSFFHPKCLYTWRWTWRTNMNLISYISPHTWCGWLRGGFCGETDVERWFVLGKIKMALVRLFIGAVNTKGSRGRKKSPVLLQVLTSASTFASFSRKNKKVKTSLSRRRHVLGFSSWWCSFL